MGVAQKEDEEERIDEQDIFDRVVFFLAALTRAYKNFLFENPPFCPSRQGGDEGERGSEEGA